MTEAAFLRALDHAVRNAVRCGRVAPKGHQAELDALSYAQALVLPIYEACMQQAVEDGYASARLAVPEAAVPPVQTGEP